MVITSTIKKLTDNCKQDCFIEWKIIYTFMKKLRLLCKIIGGWGNWPRRWTKFELNFIQTARPPLNFIGMGMQFILFCLLFFASSVPKPVGLLQSEARKEKVEKFEFLLASGFKPRTSRTATSALLDRCCVCFRGIKSFPIIYYTVKFSEKILSYLPSYSSGNPWKVLVQLGTSSTTAFYSSNQPNLFYLWVYESKNNYFMANS